MNKVCIFLFSFFSCFIVAQDVDLPAPQMKKIEAMNDDEFEKALNEFKQSLGVIDTPESRPKETLATKNSRNSKKNKKKKKPSNQQPVSSKDSQELSVKKIMDGIYTLNVESKYKELLSTVNNNKDILSPNKEEIVHLLVKAKEIRTLNQLNSWLGKNFSIKDPAIIFSAIDSKNKDIVKLIFSKYEPLDLKKMKSPLTYALALGVDNDVIMAVLNYFDPLEKDSFGQDAITIALSFNPDSIRPIVNKIEDLNIYSYGFTLFQRILFHDGLKKVPNWKDFIKELVGRGADYDAFVDTSNSNVISSEYRFVGSSLAYAFSLKDKELILLLIELGAKALKKRQKNKKNKDVTYYGAIEYAGIDVLDALKKRGDNINTMEMKMPPLHFAIMHAKEEAIKWFSDNGADLTLKSNNMNALQLAQGLAKIKSLNYKQEEYIRIVKFLKERINKN